MLIFLAGLILTGLLGSLHFTKEGGQKATVTLSILTPHGDNVRQEIGAAFQTWYRAHYGQAPDLEWIDQGGTSEDLKYVEGRYSKSPASIGIDLFFGGGTPPFRTLAKAGLLESHVLSPELLAKIPSSVGGIPIYADAEGWYGVALSSFGILFNRPLLKDKGLPEPRSWSDLARPGAKGWVACVDPRGSGSAHVIYEIILQKYGWEKGWEILARMAANSSHFTKGASAVLPLVASGDAAYTMAIDQYAWSLIEKIGVNRVGFVLPQGETVVSPDPVAMLKGAPHKQEAIRFMEFLYSEPGQLLLSLKAGFPGGPARLSLNRMSVLPEVFPKLDSNNSFIRGDPFADAARATWVYSDSLTETRWSLVNDALGLWMVDNHASALKALEALDAQSADNKFFRAPADWEVMRGYAERWKDQSFRNATMALWARELND